MQLMKVCLFLATICGLATFSIALLFAGQHLQGQHIQEEQTLRLIVDTDIGPWPDDVGALSILNTYADRGRLEILAIMANNAYEGVVPVIDAMNAYFNRSDQIQIGVTKDPNAMKEPGNFGWPKYVLKHFPHPNYQNNSQAQDAVKLYRKILASAKDKSITILSIGYLTNLANLLHTTGDQYSNASGVELIREKVKKMVVMAGWFPTGHELNIGDRPEAAREALLHWPTPITFVGFEVGEKIRCGGNLINFTTNSSILANSPVSKAFEFAYIKLGQIDGCFDEVATYIAVEGVKPFYDLVQGQIEILPNGTDLWNINTKDNVTQAYVKQIHENDTQTIVNDINPLLVR